MRGSDPSKRVTPIHISTFPLVDWTSIRLYIGCHPLAPPHFLGFHFFFFFLSLSLYNVLHLRPRILSPPPHPAGPLGSLHGMKASNGGSTRREPTTDQDHLRRAFPSLSCTGTQVLAVEVARGGVFHGALFPAAATCSLASFTILRHSPLLLTFLYSFSSFALLWTLL